MLCIIGVGKPGLLSGLLLGQKTSEITEVNGPTHCQWNLVNSSLEFSFIWINISL